MKIENYYVFYRSNCNRLWKTIRDHKSETQKYIFVLFRCTSNAHLIKQNEKKNCILIHLHMSDRYV